MVEMSPQWDLLFFSEQIQKCSARFIAESRDISPVAGRVQISRQISFVDLANSNNKADMEKPQKPLGKTFSNISEFHQL